MKKMLNVALPKGRLGEKVYDMFEKRGAYCHRARNAWVKAKKAEGEAAPVRYSADDLYKALPEFDPSKSIATRAANNTVMNALAKVACNLIGGSADLEPSNKTGLKESGWISADDFSGRNIHFGIRELAMSAIVNGITAYGGYRAFGATFFVFSDYMKPAIRMSALMRLKVIYVWSHDSFRVGEDGPTHQPIEQEMQIRLMEQVHNHRGERSMVVLRPADAEETVVAWQYAMSEQRPVALIFSRQNVKSIPPMGSSRKQESQQAMKGAYIVMDSAKAQVVMLASGSEVSPLTDGAELLQKDGIPVRVVSVPSEGLFRDQPKSYQESVLPKDIIRYGMTSGLSINLRGLVGENGTIHGCDHFGYSAPFKVLDEKFGYNGQTVYEEVKAMIKG